MSRKTLHVAVILSLFTVAAVIEALHCSSLSSFSNADIWWHLRSGLWILHNHALPHSGLFSQSPDQPWIAVSWLYEVKLAVWYELLGLGSIPVFLMFFKAALAVVTFLLAGGTRGNFWPAVALSAVAQYIVGAVPPLPAYGSILLFGVALLLLFESRRSGRLRPLFWLPPIFLVWANLHIQFVYGVAVLLLFMLVLVFESVTSTAKAATEKAGLTAALIAALSLVATVITPYFYHPYGVFFSTAFSIANSYLPDFHAPRFHQSQDYLLLLLVMFAFFALGIRRSRDPFQIALLAGCALLSFRSQRDLWLVTLAAVAVIGNVRASRESEGTSQPSLSNRSLLLAAALSIAILIVVAVLRIPRSADTLLTKAGQNYPVAACNYIREHRLPQPLFNAFEWGGFLTWYLPEYPVAIDGRTDLYGDDFVIEYSKVMNADAPYKEFPALAGAHTILLPHSAIMAEALSTVPGFKVAYSDNVATVLTKGELAKE